MSDTRNQLITNIKRIIDSHGFSLSPIDVVWRMASDFHPNYRADIESYLVKVLHGNPESVEVFVDSILKANDTSEGSHYKQALVLKSDLGQPIDPAWIATKHNLSPMLFTVQKKIIRCGKSHKSQKQDIRDCIGALNRELELIKLQELDK